MQDFQKPKLKETQSCPVCGKHLAPSSGSMTWWIFRRTCDCNAESPIVRVATHLKEAERAQTHLVAPDATMESFSPLKNELIAADKYNIVRLIARGGMGQVFEATDSAGNRVALKIVRQELACDAESVLRFKKEIEAALNLSHENIVKVLDHGVTPAGLPYLVMEYVEGKNLAQLIENKEVDWKTAVEIFQQIAAAVGYAHRAGILHRDLKPANVLIVTRDGQRPKVKIIDFGIAKAIQEAVGATAAVTQTGEILGSPTYMSPERCRGFNSTAQSDIYSFGCLMYETLTGRPPFEGETPLEVMFAHCSNAPKSFADGHLPKTLERLVLQCLQKDPNDRYRSMVDVQFDLERVSKGQLLARAHRPKLKGNYIKTIAAVACIGYMLFSFAGWLEQNSPAVIKSTKGDVVYRAKNNDYAKALAFANQRIGRLPEIDLRNKTLIGLKLPGAFLDSSNLNAAQFLLADLAHASLVNTDMAGTSFSDSQLYGARFQKSRGTGARFNRVDLTGADFEDSNFEGSDFRYSICSLAMFTRANLKNGNFALVPLHGADLRFANLENANFRNADLRNANLKLAKLAGANFANANLSGAQFDEEALKDVFLEATTVDSSLPGTIKPLVLPGEPAENVAEVVESTLHKSEEVFAHRLYNQADQYVGRAASLCDSYPKSRAFADCALMRARILQARFSNAISPRVQPLIVKQFEEAVKLYKDLSRSKVLSEDKDFQSDYRHARVGLAIATLAGPPSSAAYQALEFLREGAHTYMTASVDEANSRPQIRECLRKYAEIMWDEDDRFEAGRAEIALAKQTILLGVKNINDSSVPLNGSWRQIGSTSARMQLEIKPDSRMSGGTFHFDQYDGTIRIETTTGQKGTLFLGSASDPFQAEYNFVKVGNALVLRQISMQMAEGPGPPPLKPETAPLPEPMPVLVLVRE